MFKHLSPIEIVVLTIRVMILLYDKMIKLKLRDSVNK